MVQIPTNEHDLVLKQYFCISQKTLHMLFDKSCGKNTKHLQIEQKEKPKHILLMCANVNVHLSAI